MKNRLWMVPTCMMLFVFLLLSGCSTKSTLAPHQDNVVYKSYTLKQLPHPVGNKAREMRSTEKKGYILFYYNDTNYVLITSGRKNTGGYTIKVHKVTANNNTATIYVEDVPPKKGSMVPQVITSPVIVLSIPENIKNVQLIWDK